MNSSDESSGEQSSADEHSADEPEQEKSLTSAKNLFKPLVQKLEPCSGACHGGEHIRLELQGQVWPPWCNFGIEFVESHGTERVRALCHCLVLVIRG